MCTGIHWITVCRWHLNTANCNCKPCMLKGYWWQMYTRQWGFGLLSLETTDPAWLWVECWRGTKCQNAMKHRCYTLCSFIKEGRYVKSMLSGGKEKLDDSLNIPILVFLSLRTPLAHASGKKPLMICFGFFEKLYEFILSSYISRCCFNTQWISKFQWKWEGETNWQHKDVLPYTSVQ